MRIICTQAGYSAANGTYVPTDEKGVHDETKFYLGGRVDTGTYIQRQRKMGGIPQDRWVLFADGDLTYLCRGDFNVCPSEGWRLCSKWAPPGVPSIRVVWKTEAQTKVLCTFRSLRLPL